VNGKCQAACVAKGGSCTISADCCSPEPCIVPTGQTKGICGGVLQTDGGVTPPPPPPPDAGNPPPDSGTSTDSGTPPPPPDAGGTCVLYGQLCTSSAQCCSGVPCTGGRCRYP
jgi:hypothetical protein